MTDYIMWHYAVIYLTIDALWLSALGILSFARPDWLSRFGIKFITRERVIMSISPWIFALYVVFR